MKKIKGLLIIIMSLSLTSCNYVELNKLAIVSALGIDYKNNEYQITAQVMDIQKTENSSVETSLIYEATGKTIGKAIRNLSLKYPKTVYLGHLQIIIIGREISNSKMNDIFDFILRSPEVRDTGNILVNKKQTAKETLKPENELKNSFATEQIKSSLENATKRTGTVKLITFQELLEDYLKKGIDPVIPIIDINNDKNNTSNTTIPTLAPIKNNRVEKEFTKEEAIAYNTINENYEDIVITPKYKNETIGIILFNPKSKIKTKIKNNKIHTTIYITIETKINEVNFKINPNKQKTHKELKQVVKKELKKYITSLINYSKKNNVDVLGIENNIYKNHYKEYNKYKNNNLYENITINIETKIYRSGNTNKGAI